MKWPESIQIREVGPRDGLQNENVLVNTKDKVTWINLLSRSGLKYIEVTSYVSPKWIPALADASKVVQMIDRVPGVTYSALVPNKRGLEMALKDNIDEISVFISSSETHNQKNINKGIKESLSIIKTVIQEAKQEGKKIRGYISTVFGCPYEGEVSISSVLKIAEELLVMGINELSLGDTIGVANPRKVNQFIDNFLKFHSTEYLAMHFHDTRGLAIANIMTSMLMGITKYDSSVGGLGGCPYAPGAAGNVSSEDLVYCLNDMDVKTNIDFTKLLEVSKIIQEKIGRKLPSKSLELANC